MGCPRRPVIPGGRDEQGEEGTAGGGARLNLDEEWKHIAYCIEAELCRECDCVNNDGTPDEKYIGRGNGLQLVRRPLLPPRTAARHGRVDARLHKLAWTLNRMEELIHLASRGGGRVGRRYQESAVGARRPCPGQARRVCGAVGGRGCRVGRDGKVREGPGGGDQWRGRTKPRTGRSG